MRAVANEDWADHCNWIGNLTTEIVIVHGMITRVIASALSFLLLSTIFKTPMDNLCTEEMSLENSV